MDQKPDSTESECACPTDCRIARHFDAKVAERLATGRDPGLVAVSQRLRDVLLAMDPSGRTVLELGCGRGGLLIQLVRAGASQAMGVDLSAASIAAARNRFDQAQLSERVRLSVGDAALVPLEPADWVILDRVMCCYPEVERLLAVVLTDVVDKRESPRRVRVVEARTVKGDSRGASYGSSQRVRSSAPGPADPD